MKFIYGRSDWADGWRGEENCYLLTNGLGGFSSSTMVGSSARNDHSFFMACLKAPNHRYSMVHRLEEILELDGREVHLSSQKYAEETRDEEGFRFLDSFCFEDYPRWIFHVDGVEIEKEIAMQQGENVIAVRYRLENRTGREVTLKVMPHLQFCPKGKQPHKGQKFVLRRMAGQRAEKFVITSDAADGLELYFSTNGAVRTFPTRFVTGLYYAYDECDGRNPQGSTCVNHWIEKRAAAGECVSLEIVYRMDPACTADKFREDFRISEAESLQEDSRTSETEKLQEAPRASAAKSVPGGDSVSENGGWKNNASTEAARTFEDAVRYREKLAETSGLRGETARMLAKSAGQFVAERESTGGKTILAGFPFFEDWGRDTMIAVAGCCISTGQFETAKSILRTFAAYCKEGLMPNLFPEGKNEPMYNTVDASLLFIHAVYLYYEKQTGQADCLPVPALHGFAAERSGECAQTVSSIENTGSYSGKSVEDSDSYSGRSVENTGSYSGKSVKGSDSYSGKPQQKNPDGLNFVKEMWPVMCEIIDWYRKGTLYGIHMDEDGLLAAGQGLDQVTWMDVRIGDILPTPRHGKPVEVNAYWYNALCIMGLFGKLLNRKKEDIREYDSLAQKAGKSFREKFWNEKTSCLKDVLSEHDGKKEGSHDRGEGGSGQEESGPDEQIRCNQIWAVSMPFCALDLEKQKKVVDTVFEKLYTPYGLRTLAKDDPEFHGTYGGSQLKRDLAYHQGTVWVFPLGAYYLAYLKTEGYSCKALETVRRQLEPLESALREGCIGQLPEIYDGEFPSFSRGCFAQAWSVGEILRVYEALEAAQSSELKNTKKEPAHRRTI